MTSASGWRLGGSAIAGFRFGIVAVQGRRQAGQGRRRGSDVPGVLGAADPLPEGGHIQGHKAYLARHCLFALSWAFTSGGGR